MNSHTDHPSIARFLDTIRPWHHAYANSIFSFVALLHQNQWIIVRSRIRLNTISPPVLRPAFSTKSLRAGEARFDGRPEALVQFISAALSGNLLSVGDWNLTFLIEQGSSLTATHYAPFEFSAHNSAGVNRLVMGGASRWSIISPRDVELEKELRPRGFQSVNDLARSYDLDFSASDNLVIEITAESIVEIDPGSSLKGQVADITVRLAMPLHIEEFTLVLVDTASKGQMIRHTLSGAEIEWKNIENEKIGVCHVTIPHQAVLSCQAVYAGSLHDQMELEDTAALPNSRRMVVEMADPGLKRLRGPLTQPKSYKEQNEFESAVAALLFMLGFESVRVGGIKKLTDAADIFAMTSSQEILVVECTTEVLDPKGKLSKLLLRVDEAKKIAASTLSGLDRFRITGIIVIPKDRNELGPEWKAAENRGVLILCRSDIEDALDRTRFPPNANEVLSQWRQQPLINLLSSGLGSLSD